MGRTHVQQGWEVHTGHYSTKRRATHSCHFVTVHVSLYSIYYTVMIVLCRYSLFRIARSITPNIIMFLPRNIDLEQLEELARLSSPPLTLEVNHCQEERHYKILLLHSFIMLWFQIEENYVQGKIKAIKAYFSCSAKKNLTFHLSESPTELESDLVSMQLLIWWVWCYWFGEYDAKHCAVLFAATSLEDCTKLWDDNKKTCLRPWSIFWQKNGQAH